MNGPAWWCPGDGWTGRFSLLDAQGSVSVDTYADDNAASKVLSTTVNTASYVYVKVKADDSWCNDGFDYTLTPSIDKANRDYDEDGFIDNDDDCDDRTARRAPGLSEFCDGIDNDWDGSVDDS